MEMLKRETEDKLTAFIVSPTFVYEDRLKIMVEKDFPPESLFIPLGWNRTPTDDKKHYRRYYPDELENVQ